MVLVWVLGCCVYFLYVDCLFGCDWKILKIKIFILGYECVKSKKVIFLVVVGIVLLRIWVVEC